MSETLDTYGLRSSYEFRVVGDSFAKMSTVQSQLEGIRSAVKETSNALDRSGMGRSLQAIATQVHGGVDRVSDSVHDMGKTSKTVARQLMPLKQEMKALRAESRLIDFGDMGDDRQFKKATTEVRHYIGALKDLEAQVGRDTALEREFSSELKRRQRMASSQVATNKAQREALESAGRMGASQGLRDTGEAILNPLVSMGGDAIKILSGFNDQMSTIDAVSKMTANQLDSLRQKAKGLGASTRFSTSEAAEGFVNLAQAGYSVQDQMTAIDGTLNLAAAGALGLAEATEITVSSLGAFGLVAKNAGHAADVLAYAANAGVTNVQDIGAALEYAGPPAKAFGASIEETTAMISLLSNAGIKASSAGTALRSGFLRLAAPPKAAAGAIAELNDAVQSAGGEGFAISNADGSIRKMGDILADMKVAMANYNDTQKIAAVKDIFGAEAVSSFMYMIDNTNKVDKTEDKLAQLTAGAIASSKGLGSATESARTMEDNLGGSFRNFESAIEGLKIAFIEPLEPMLRMIVDLGSNFANFFSSLPGPILFFISVTLGLVTALSALSVVVGTLGVAFFGFKQAAAAAQVGMIALHQSSIPLTGFFQTAMTAFQSKGPVSAIKDLTSHLELLPGVAGKAVVAMRFLGNSALTFLTSPIGIAIAGLSLLLILLEKATPQMDIFGSSMTLLKMPFKVFSSFIDGIKTGFQQAMGDEFIKQFQPVFDTFNKTFNDLYDKFENLSTIAMSAGMAVGRIFAVLFVPMITAQAKTARLIVSIWSGAISGILGVFERLINFLPFVKHMLLANLAQNSPGPTVMIPRYWDAAVKKIKAIWEGLVSNAKKVGAAILGSLAIGLTFFRPLLGTVKNFVVLIAITIGQIGRLAADLSIVWKNSASLGSKASLSLILAFHAVSNIVTATVRFLLAELIKASGALLRFAGLMGSWGAALLAPLLKFVNLGSVKIPFLIELGTKFAAVWGKVQQVFLPLTRTFLVIARAIGMAAAAFAAFQILIGAALAIGTILFLVDVLQNGLVTAIKDASDVVGTLFSLIYNSASQSIQSILSIKDAFVETWSSVGYYAAITLAQFDLIADRISRIAASGKKVFAGFANRVMSAFQPSQEKGNPGAIAGLVSAAMAETSGFTSTTSAIQTGFLSTTNSVVSGMERIASAATETGDAVSQSLGDSLVSRLGSAWGTVSRITSGAYNSFFAKAYKFSESTDSKAGPILPPSAGQEDIGTKLDQTVETVKSKVSGTLGSTAGDIAANAYRPLVSVLKLLAPIGLIVAGTFSQISHAIIGGSNAASDFGGAVTTDFISFFKAVTDFETIASNALDILTSAIGGQFTHFVSQLNGLNVLLLLASTALLGLRSEWSAALTPLLTALPALIGLMTDFGLLDFGLPNAEALAKALGENFIEIQALIATLGGLATLATITPLINQLRQALTPLYTQTIDFFKGVGDAIRSLGGVFPYLVSQANKLSSLAGAFYLDKIAPRLAALTQRLEPFIKAAKQAGAAIREGWGWLLNQPPIKIPLEQIGQEWIKFKAMAKVFFEPAVKFFDSQVKPRLEQAISWYSKEIAPKLAESWDKILGWAKRTALIIRDAYGSIGDSPLVKFVIGLARGSGKLVGNIISGFIGGFKWSFGSLFSVVSGAIGVFRFLQVKAVQTIQAFKDGFGRLAKKFDPMIQQLSRIAQGISQVVRNTYTTFSKDPRDRPNYRNRFLPTSKQGQEQALTPLDLLPRNKKMRERQTKTLLLQDPQMFRMQTEDAEGFEAELLKINEHLAKSNAWYNIMGSRFLFSKSSTLAVSVIAAQLGWIALGLMAIVGAVYAFDAAYPGTVGPFLKGLWEIVKVVVMIVALMIKYAIPALKLFAKGVDLLLNTLKYIVVTPILLAISLVAGAIDLLLTSIIFIARRVRWLAQSIERNLGPVLKGALTGALTGDWSEFAKAWSELTARIGLAHIRMQERIWDAGHRLNEALKQGISNVGDWFKKKGLQIENAIADIFKPRPFTPFQDVRNAIDATGKKAIETSEYVFTEIPKQFEAFKNGTLSGLKMLGLGILALTALYIALGLVMAGSFSPVIVVIGVTAAAIAFMFGSATGQVQDFAGAVIMFLAPIRDFFDSVFRGTLKFAAFPIDIDGFFGSIAGGVGVLFDKFKPLLWIVFALWAVFRMIGKKSLFGGLYQTFDDIFRLLGSIVSLAGNLTSMAFGLGKKKKEDWNSLEGSTKRAKQVRAVRSFDGSVNLPFVGKKQILPFGLQNIPKIGLSGSKLAEADENIQKRTELVEYRKLAKKEVQDEVAWRKRMMLNSAALIQESPAYETEFTDKYLELLKKTVQVGEKSKWGGLIKEKDPKLTKEGEQYLKTYAKQLEAGKADTGGGWKDLGNTYGDGSTLMRGLDDHELQGLAKKSGLASKESGTFENEIMRQLAFGKLAIDPYLKGEIPRIEIRAASVEFTGNPLGSDSGKAPNDDLAQISSLIKKQKSYVAQYEPEEASLYSVFEEDAEGSFSALKRQYEARLEAINILLKTEGTDLAALTKQSSADISAFFKDVNSITEEYQQDMKLPSPQTSEILLKLQKEALGKTIEFFEAFKTSVEKSLPVNPTGDSQPKNVPNSKTVNPNKPARTPLLPTFLEYEQVSRSQLRDAATRSGADGTKPVFKSAWNAINSETTPGKLQDVVGKQGVSRGGRKSLTALLNAMNIKGFDFPELNSRGDKKVMELELELAFAKILDAVGRLDSDITDSFLTTKQLANAKVDDEEVFQHMRNIGIAEDAISKHVKSYRDANKPQTSSGDKERNRVSFLIKPILQQQMELLRVAELSRNSWEMPAYEDNYLKELISQKLPGFKEFTLSQVRNGGDLSAFGTHLKALNSTAGKSSEELRRKVYDEMIELQRQWAFGYEKKMGVALGPQNDAWARIESGKTFSPPPVGFDPQGVPVISQSKSGRTAASPTEARDPAWLRSAQISDETGTKKRVSYDNIEAVRTDIARELKKYERIKSVNSESAMRQRGYSTANISSLRSVEAALKPMAEGVDPRLLEQRVRYIVDLLNKRIDEEAKKSGKPATKDRFTTLYGDRMVMTPTPFVTELNLDNSEQSLLKGDYSSLRQGRFEDVPDQLFRYFSEQIGVPQIALRRGHALTDPENIGISRSRRQSVEKIGAASARQMKDPSLKSFSGISQAAGLSQDEVSKFLLGDSQPAIVEAIARALDISASELSDRLNVADLLVLKGKQPVGFAEKLSNFIQDLPSKLYPDFSKKNSLETLRAGLQKEIQENGKLSDSRIGAFDTVIGKIADIHKKAGVINGSSDWMPGASLNQMLAEIWNGMNDQERTASGVKTSEKLLSRDDIKAFYSTGKFITPAKEKTFNELERVMRGLVENDDFTELNLRTIEQFQEKQVSRSQKLQRSASALFANIKSGVGAFIGVEDLNAETKKSRQMSELNNLSAGERQKRQGQNIGLLQTSIKQNKVHFDTTDKENGAKELTIAYKELNEAGREVTKFAKMNLTARPQLEKGKIKLEGNPTQKSLEIDLANLLNISDAAGTIWSADLKEMLKMAQASQNAGKQQFTVLKMLKGVPGVGGIVKRFSSDWADFSVIQENNLEGLAKRNGLTIQMLVDEMRLMGVPLADIDKILKTKAERGSFGNASDNTLKTLKLSLSASDKIASMNEDQFKAFINSPSFTIAEGESFLVFGLKRALKKSPRMLMKGASGLFVPMFKGLGFVFGKLVWPIWKATTKSLWRKFGVKLLSGTKRKLSRLFQKSANFVLNNIGRWMPFKWVGKIESGLRGMSGKVDKFFDRKVSELEAAKREADAASNTGFRGLIKNLFGSIWSKIAGIGKFIGKTAIAKSPLGKMPATAINAGRGARKLVNKLGPAVLKAGDRIGFNRRNDAFNASMRDSNSSMPPVTTSSGAPEQKLLPGGEPSKAERAEAQARSILPSSQTVLIPPAPASVPMLAIAPSAPIAGLLPGQGQTGGKAATSAALDQQRVVLKQIEDQMAAQIKDIGGSAENYQSSLVEIPEHIIALQRLAEGLQVKAAEQEARFYQAYELAQAETDKSRKHLLVQEARGAESVHGQMLRLIELRQTEYKTAVEQYGQAMDQAYGPRTGDYAEIASLQKQITEQQIKASELELQLLFEAQGRIKAEINNIWSAKTSPTSNQPLPPSPSVAAMPQLALPAASIAGYLSPAPAPIEVRPVQNRPIAPPTVTTPALPQSYAQVLPPVQPLLPAAGQLAPRRTALESIANNQLPFADLLAPIKNTLEKIAPELESSVHKLIHGTASLATTLADGLKQAGKEAVASLREQASNIDDRWTRKAFSVPPESPESPEKYNVSGELFTYGNYQPVQGERPVTGPPGKEDQDRGFQFRSVKEPPIQKVFFNKMADGIEQPLSFIGEQFQATADRMVDTWHRSGDEVGRRTFGSLAARAGITAYETLVQWDRAADGVKSAWAGAKNVVAGLWDKMSNKAKEKTGPDIIDSLNHGCADVTAAAWERTGQGFEEVTDGMVDQAVVAGSQIAEEMKPPHLAIPEVPEAGGRHVKPELQGLGHDPTLGGFPAPEHPKGHPKGHRGLNVGGAISEGANSIQSLESAATMLSPMLDNVIPGFGAATAGLSSFAGMAGVIPALLSPMTLALGAVAIAVGLLYFAFKNNWFGLHDRVTKEMPRFIAMWEVLKLGMIYVGKVVAQMAIGAIAWMKRFQKEGFAMLPGLLPFFKLLKAFFALDAAIVILGVKAIVFGLKVLWEIAKKLGGPLLKTGFATLKLGAVIAMIALSPLIAALWVLWKIGKLIASKLHIKINIGSLDDAAAAIDTLANGLSAIPDRMIAATNSMKERMGAAVDWIKDKWQSFKNWFSGLMNLLPVFGVKAGDGLINALNHSPTVKIPKSWDKASGSIQGSIGDIVDAAQDAGDSSSKAMSSIPVGGILGDVVGVVNQVKGAIATIKGEKEKALASATTDGQMSLFDASSFEAESAKVKKGLAERVEAVKGFNAKVTTMITRARLGVNVLKHFNIINPDQAAALTTGIQGVQNLNTHIGTAAGLVDIVSKGWKKMPAAMAKGSTAAKGMPSTFAAIGKAVAAAFLSPWFLIPALIIGAFVLVAIFLKEQFGIDLFEPIKKGFANLFESSKKGFTNLGIVIVSAMIGSVSRLKGAWDGFKSHFDWLIQGLAKPAQWVAQKLIDLLNHNPTVQIPLAWEGAVERIVGSLFHLPHVGEMIQGMMKDIFHVDNIFENLTPEAIGKKIEDLKSAAGNWVGGLMGGGKATAPEVLGPPLPGANPPIVGDRPSVLKNQATNWLGGLGGDKPVVPTEMFGPPLPKIATPVEAAKPSGFFAGLQDMGSNLLSTGAAQFGIGKTQDLAQYASEQSPLMASMVGGLDEMGLGQTKVGTMIKTGQAIAQKAPAVIESVKSKVEDSPAKAKGKGFWSSIGGWFGKKKEVATPAEEVTNDYGQLLKSTMETAKFRIAPESVKIAIESLPTQMTGRQFDAVSNDPDMSGIIKSGESRMNFDIGLEENKAAAGKKVGELMETVKNEWGDRWDYLQSTGMSDLYTLFRPGLDEVREGFGTLGSDIGSFAKRAGTAILHLDMKELVQSAKDFGGNFMAASGRIVEGFSSMSASAIVFGIWSLISFSPVVTAMLAIGLVIAIVAFNFLGLRDVVVGIGTAFWTLIKIVRSLLKFARNVADSIKQIFKGLAMALTGDFSEIGTGWQMLYTSFQTLANEMTVLFGELCAAVWQILKPIRMMGEAILGVGKDLVESIFNPTAAWERFGDLIESIRIKISEVGLAIENSPLMKMGKALGMRMSGKASSVKEAYGEVTAVGDAKKNDLEERKNKVRGRRLERGEVVKGFAVNELTGLPEAVEEATTKAESRWTRFVEFLKFNPAKTAPAELGDLPAEVQLVATQVEGQWQGMTTAIAMPIQSGDLSALQATGEQVTQIASEVKGNWRQMTETLDPIAVDLGPFSDGTVQITAMMQTMQSGFMGFVDKFRDNPVPLAISGEDLPDQLSLITAQATGTWMGFKEAIENIPILSDFIGMIQSIPEMVQQVVAQIQGLFGAMSASVSGTVQGVADNLTATLGSVAEETAKVQESIKQKGLLTTIGERAAEDTKKVGQGVRGFFGGKKKVDEVAANAEATAQIQQAWQETESKVISSIEATVAASAKAGNDHVANLNHNPTERIPAAWSGASDEIQSSIAALVQYTENAGESLNQALAPEDVLTHASSVQDAMNQYLAGGGKMTDEMQKITATVDAAVDNAAEAASKSAGIGDKFDSISSGISSIGDAISVVNPKMGGAVKGFGSFLDGALDKGKSLLEARDTFNNLRKGIAERGGAKKIGGGLAERAQGWRQGLAGKGGAGTVLKEGASKAMGYIQPIVTFIKASWGWIVGIIGGIMSGAITMGTILGAIGSAFATIGGIIGTIASFLGGPVIIALLVIAALVYAFTTNFMGINDMFAQLWESIKGFGAAIWGFIQPILNFIVSVGKIALQIIAFAIILPLKLVFMAVGNVFRALGFIFKVIGTIGTVIYKMILFPFKAIGDLLGLLWKGLELIGSAVFWIGSVIFKMIAVPFRLVGALLVGIFKIIAAIGMFLLKVILAPFVLVAVVIGTIGKAIWSAAGAVWNGLGGAFNFVKGIVESIFSTVQKVQDFLSDPAGAIGKWVGSMFSGGQAAPMNGQVQPATGDNIQKLARGGLVRGPGTGTGDRVPVLASANEFIVNAASTRRHYGLLEEINNDELTVAPPTTPIMVSAPSSSGVANSRQADQVTGAVPPIQVIFQIENINLSGGSAAADAEEFLDAIEPKLQRRLRDILRDLTDRAR